MLGYKGFDADMTCLDFQYEPGKVYEMDGEIELCKSGFHFCPKMADVFDYYDKNDCRYAEVEALGQVIKGNDKCVTDRLRIVRELTKADIFNVMYAQSGLELKGLPFPADEVIKAREDGTLDKLLPSGTEFSVRFSNGEWNVFVAARDNRHTYLITKYTMMDQHAMNPSWTNKGGWPVCKMREHVNEIYDMLPEDIRKIVVPIHIKQYARRKVVECDDMAFLLSVTNVFGTNALNPEADCDDTQIDIFRGPAAGIKGRLGASSNSWWWLRSAGSGTTFNIVNPDGGYTDRNANSERGVVVGFCIEDRGIGAAS